MTVPYTYLIRFKPTGQVYYGCRYAANCDPSDLFVSYFTSSKIVKNLIKLHGKESFEFEIRRKFKTKEECIYWEQRVLRKMKTKRDERFLNLNCNSDLRNAINFKFKTIMISNPETGICTRIIDNSFIPEGWIRGNINNYRPKKNNYKWYSNNETGEEIFCLTPPNNSFVLGRSKSMKDSIRKNKTGGFNITDGKILRFLKFGEDIPPGFYKGSAELKNNTGNKKWINNGVNEKYTNIDLVVPEGWELGRLKKNKTKT